MPSSRHDALHVVRTRRPRRPWAPKDPIATYYGSRTLGLSGLKKRLSERIYGLLLRSIEEGIPVTQETAQAVAVAARTWAMEQGATHYTHWFHPLTGATAEKHDTFFDYRKNTEMLKGRELVQQEPDASSFPHGGIRSTFEARGYTAWDPSSPFFIWDTTLCIPTIFVSYTGDALDFKVPLLKSIQTIDRSATRLCRLFGKRTRHVVPMVGWEQEYFVVDRALHNARPDLVMCGRTVFGHAPARGQQLEDHYFGPISPRIMNFMKSLEYEAHRLGIPLSTRHNEVAPAQYELAPTFTSANLANDHNQLLRDIMQKIAQEHHLCVLFHEKPFEGLNGNGKHCNWSLATDTGVNLMQPSDKLQDNLFFLLFFIATLRAVHTYSDLLAASIASYGNEFRLGGHEAPPAILSVFIGDVLEQILNDISRTKSIHRPLDKAFLMKLGVDRIPQITRDNTDRNRTSPFAFTGNKFEFRSVGADSNIARPLTILNTIVAEQIDSLHRLLLPASGGRNKEQLLARTAQVLGDEVAQCRDIIFNGDGYSQDWVKEAQKRKLCNVPDTPHALAAYLKKKNIALLNKHKVLSLREVTSRNEIMLNGYVKKIEIESRLMQDLVDNHVLPTAVQYQHQLIENIEGLLRLSLDAEPLQSLLLQINKHLARVQSEVRSMQKTRSACNAIPDTMARATAYAEKIKKRYFGRIREIVDALELLVDDKLWPLVKYRELLFFR